MLLLEEGIASYFTIEMHCESSYYMNAFEMLLF